MTTIGWDIGGAHLKAARVERDASGHPRIVAVAQVPCQLWVGLDRLHTAIDEITAVLGPAAQHAATMTGELTDLFTSRTEGVVALAGVAAARLVGSEGAPVRLYAGRAGFVAPEAAGGHVADIASANWHATAALAGRAGGEALLVDIGSTTTDIIPVGAAGSAARGYSDSDRLATGELIYTGAVRTMLMAFDRTVPFRGGRVGIMAEYFAVIADVHRIRGVLPEDADLHATPDGRPKTAEASRLRLARMIGRDVEEASEAEWLALAEHYASRQIDWVEEGARQALSGATLSRSAPVIGCGVGRFIAADLAGRLGRDYRDLADVLVEAGDVIDAPTATEAAKCAPAAAVALEQARLGAAG